MLSMSTTTLDHLYQLEDSQRSIVIFVMPLTAIGKSRLVSLFYAIKVATIKSAFVSLGSPTESEHRLLLLLGILEISSPQPIQCIAESSLSNLLDLI